MILIFIIRIFSSLLCKSVIAGMFHLQCLRSLLIGSQTRPCSCAQMALCNCLRTLQWRGTSQPEITRYDCNATCSDVPESRFCQSFILFALSRTDTILSAVLFGVLKWHEDCLISNKFFSSACESVCQISRFCVTEDALLAFIRKIVHRVAGHRFKAKLLICQRDEQGRRAQVSIYRSTDHIYTKKGALPSSLRER